MNNSPISSCIFRMVGCYCVPRTLLQDQLACHQDRLACHHASVHCLDVAARVQTRLWWYRKIYPGTCSMLAVFREFPVPCCHQLRTRARCSGWPEYVSRLYVNVPFVLQVVSCIQHSIGIEKAVMTRSLCFSYPCYRFFTRKRSQHGTKKNSIYV